MTETASMHGPKHHTCTSATAVSALISQSILWPTTAKSTEAEAVLGWGGGTDTQFISGPYFHGDI